MACILFRMKYIFILLTLIVMGSAHSRVVHSNLSVTYKGVVHLQGIGSCTGSVVGLYPPTVITARHCVQTGVVAYKNVRPETIIEDQFEDRFFSTENAALPGDIAILIYPFSSESKFREDMSEKDLFTISKFNVSPWKKISFCGFGSSAESYGDLSGIGEQRCGQNYVQLPVHSAQFSQKLNPGLLKDMSEEEKIIFIHTLMQSVLKDYGHNTRIGIAALTFPDTKNPHGTYDSKHVNSLIQQGDSGGPFFFENGDEKTLVAVNSMGILSKERLFIGSVAWRLDHPWTKTLLKKAYNFGADIKGYKP